MSDRPLTLSFERRRRLADELNEALAGTSTRDLADWSKRCGHNVLAVSRRRIMNLKAALSNLATVIAAETVQASASVRRGEARAYLKAVESRLSCASTSVYAKTQLLWSQVRRNPRQAAVEFAAAALGFYLGSGGLDGDGGIPDLDLQLGIGAHRSILTHSVLSGIAIECVACAAVDLARVVYGKLPADHDPLWDEILSTGDLIAARLTTGMSAGIAYHLGIDATVDGEGTFKDLPISLPLPGHQAIAALNAAAEALDAGVRPPSIVGVYPTFKAAAEAVKRAKSTSFKVRRSAAGDMFEVVFAPRRARLH